MHDRRQRQMCIRDRLKMLKWYFHKHSLQVNCLVLKE
jgi:hypothetical protein